MVSVVGHSPRSEPQQRQVIETMAARTCVPANVHHRNVPVNLPLSPDDEYCTGRANSVHSPQYRVLSCHFPLRRTSTTEKRGAHSAKAWHNGPTECRSALQPLHSRIRNMAATRINRRRRCLRACSLLSQESAPRRTGRRRVWRSYVRLSTCSPRPCRFLTD